MRFLTAPLSWNLFRYNHLVGKWGMGGRIFFEKKFQLAGVELDPSSEAGRPRRPRRALRNSAGLT